MLFKLGFGLGGCGRSGAASLSPYLDGVMSGVVADLDATIAASYSGTGQLWANLTAAPADGAAQGAHDFDLGGTDLAGSGDDPVFTGQAGDSAAYFAMSTTTSGFQTVTTSATATEQLAGQPAFYKDFHKSTAGARWVGIALRSASWAPGANLLMGTENNETKHGFKLEYNGTSSRMILTIGDGASGVIFEFPLAILADNTDYLIVLHLESAGGTTTARLYVNHTLPYIAQGSYTDTTDATGEMTFGNDDSFSHVPAGTRIYWCGAGAGNMTQAAMRALKNHLEARHNRVYVAHDPQNDGSQPVDAALPSAVCDLDTGLAGSYGGTGQIWANLVANPADGANQADYDFWLGLDGTGAGGDPVFNGTAGQPGACWDLDGGDYFKIRNIAAAPLLDRLTFTDGSIAGAWLAMIVDLPAHTAVWQSFFGSAWTGSDSGVIIAHDGDSPRFWSANGSVNSGALDFGAPDVDSLGPFLLLFSYDPAIATNNMRIWIGSRMATQTASYVFNANTAAKTSDTGESFFIGASSNGGAATGILPAGTKIYHVSMGEEFLTDSRAGQLIDHLERRYERRFSRP